MTLRTCDNPDVEHPGFPCDHRPEPKCEYCGKPESEVGEVPYHSGSRECWPCWNWRKLDSPAASHWAPIFRSFFSNVDLHDAMTFFPKTLDLDKDERNELFRLMHKAMVNCDHAIALRENAWKDRLAAK